MMMLDFHREVWIPNHNGEIKKLVRPVLNTRRADIQFENLTDNKIDLK
jgi:hypothetical protein